MREHPGDGRPNPHRLLGTYGGRGRGSCKETSAEQIGRTIEDPRGARQGMSRGGKEIGDGRGEGESEDGDGGGGRRPMGESCRVDADGVQGRQPGRRGDVADGGYDTQGEGGVSGNRAGESNMEITNINPPSPTHGDKAP